MPITLSTLKAFLQHGSTRREFDGASTMNIKPVRTKADHRAALQEIESLMFTSLWRGTALRLFKKRLCHHEWLPPSRRSAQP
jgi:hypothetical protein